MGFSLKYGKVTTENGMIPDDEPVFVLRAKDNLSIKLLGWYLAMVNTRLGEGTELEAQTRLTADGFKAWREANAVVCKNPD